MSVAYEPRLTGGSGHDRRLSPDECRNWLKHHSEGRLRYWSGRGPRGVVVRYALSGDHITFRLPDYNDIVHFAPGEPVTLTVDGTPSPAAGYETVSVVGTARLAGVDTPSDADEAQLDETWPPGVATTVIELPLVSVSGVVQQPGAADTDFQTEV